MKCIDSQWDYQLIVIIYYNAVSDFKTHRLTKASSASSTAAS